ncbi:MAG: M6 family metalloprotease domain-containing protein [Bacteroidales bacterium]|jgi:M6 family metalloprotease-like protein|nr:M6 family metalloprotease domain-containing protein [Bacteroidales bacterium]
MIKSFLIAGCLLTGSLLFGVPANPKHIEKTQPDGTKITVLLKGDEKIHWMETLDGYTLMYSPERYIVFATTDGEGNMTPSENVYYGEKPESGIVKNIRYSQAQKNALMSIWKTVDNIEKSKKSRSVIGEKKALCVLMNFPDKTMIKTKAEFENLFNQIGYSANGAYGSVRDFYRENSYGKMDFVVTFAGPYTTSKNESEYVSESNYANFAREAAELADADIDYADFANDENKLESFHIIFAGYGDESIGNGQQIWSHKSGLPSPIMLDSVAVQVYSCSPELRDNSGTEISHIGAACHELCHVFGAPDYYDIDNVGSGGNYQGTGVWDLMAAGSWNDDGARPAHINMFQKSLFGWVNFVELSSGKTVVDMPHSVDSAMAYTVKVNPDGEMYILENVQQEGFNIGLPGHGLLIYHVHADALSSYADNSSHPQELYPVCAGTVVQIPTSDPNSYGRLDVQTGKNEINTQRCPFPGSLNKTSFSSTTTPAMFSWDTGRVFVDKPITDISENLSKRTVSFKFMGGDPRVATPVFSPDGDSYPDSVVVSILCETSGASVYYTVDGSVPSRNAILYVSPIVLKTPTTLKAIAYKDGLDNSNTGTASYSFCAMLDVSAEPHLQDFEDDLGCWSPVAADPASDNASTTHNNGWGIRDYNGSKVWRFSSWRSATDYTQYLISPKLVVDGYGRKCSFYYKKSNAKNETFAVGYSTVNNNAGNFVWSSPVVASNQNEWAFFSDTTIPFDAKYIAIKYLSDNSYYLYIDSFTIEKTSAFTEPPVANEELKRSDIKIYPNPNSGEFFIDVPETSTVRIWNMAGAKVIERQITGLNTFFLKQSGIYAVQIIFSGSGDVLTEKVVVK